MAFLSDLLHLRTLSWFHYVIAFAVGAWSYFIMFPKELQWCVFVKKTRTWWSTTRVKFSRPRHVRETAKAAAPTTRKKEHKTAEPIENSEERMEAIAIYKEQLFNHFRSLGATPCEVEHFWRIEEQRLSHVPTIPEEIPKRHDMKKIKATRGPSGVDLGLWMCERLTKVLRKKPEFSGNDWDLRLYGSMANGFAESKDDGSPHNSDVDSSFIMDTKLMTERGITLQKLVEAATEDNVFIWRHSALQAKVPVVCLAMGDNMMDITLNNHHAIRNSALLREYSQVHAKVTGFVLAVKRWAKDNKLTNASEGKFSSYSWTLMALVYLQSGSTFGKVLPSLQQLAPSGSEFMSAAEYGISSMVLPPITTLLQDFFHFLAYRLDVSTQVLSLREGKLSTCLGARQHLLYRWDVPNIEDPFEMRNLNVVVSSEQAEIFKRTVKKAADAMAAEATKTSVVEAMPEIKFRPENGDDLILSPWPSSRKDSPHFSIPYVPNSHAKSSDKAPCTLHDKSGGEQSGTSTLRSSPRTQKSSEASVPAPVSARTLNSAEDAESKKFLSKILRNLEERTKTREAHADAGIYTPPSQHAHIDVTTAPFNTHYGNSDDKTAEPPNTTSSLSPHGYNDSGMYGTPSRVISLSGDNALYDPVLSPRSEHMNDASQQRSPRTLRWVNNCGYKAISPLYTMNGGKGSSKGFPYKPPPPIGRPLDTLRPQPPAVTALRPADTTTAAAPSSTPSVASTSRSSNLSTLSVFDRYSKHPGIPRAMAARGVAPPPAPPPLEQRKLTGEKNVVEHEYNNVQQLVPPPGLEKQITVRETHVVGLGTPMLPSNWNVKNMHSSWGSGMDNHASTVTEFNWDGNSWQPKNASPEIELSLPGTPTENGVGAVTAQTSTKAPHAPTRNCAATESAILDPHASAYDTQPASAKNGVAPEPGARAHNSVGADLAVLAKTGATMKANETYAHTNVHCTRRDEGPNNKGRAGALCSNGVGQRVTNKAAHDKDTAADTNRTSEGTTNPEATIPIENTTSRLDDEKGTQSTTDSSTIRAINLRQRAASVVSSNASGHARTRTSGSCDDADEIMVTTPVVFTSL
eukprot:GEMP01001061.1.p1 GENE.GEMP01001061.1~~GEMP01001061.1.p1  ORF type:complete len:1084 (+),score=239.34 GEMP01001061.1:596-3847(+)